MPTSFIAFTVATCVGLFAPPPAAQTPPAGTSTQAQATPSKPAPALSKTALPPAIEKAFKSSYPNATIKKVMKETQAGKPVYEVESVDNGKRRDLMYQPDGTVISYEEELTQADVPDAVLKAIKTRYPKAQMTRYEKLVEKGTSTFEIQLKGAGVSEAVLMPDGTWVSPKAK
jgi:Putative beta-lactamase-inhibitor-like, PepSY-like